MVTSRTLSSVVLESARIYKKFLFYLRSDPLYEAPDHLCFPKVTEMLDTDSSFGEETLEAPPPPLKTDDARDPLPNLAVRRRIERMRELKRLRELLDDPNFDDLT